jgi:hypothetical protein
VTVKAGRHRLEFLGADVDDACDVADAAVVVRAMDHRNELVVRVLDVLVVLAVLVAVVWLAVQEGDDERVFESDLDRVHADIHFAKASRQVVSKQRVAAGAVDQDVSRLEHRHGVFRRHDGSGALHRTRPARIDQVADRTLDGVERAEPQRPVVQKRHQVGRNGLSEREPLVELRRIEDRLDAISVDGIVSIALD